jgi:hypothetical protein
MVAQDLQNQIREAFPPTHFEGPVTACDCEECREIREALRNKRWDQVPADFFDLTCSPTLLTPEAFHAFLPAYLLRAINDLNTPSILVEFSVYSLSPGGDEDDGDDRSRLSRTPSPAVRQTDESGTDSGDSVIPDLRAGKLRRCRVARIFRWTGTGNRLAVIGIPQSTDCK